MFAKWFVVLCGCLLSSTSVQAVDLREVREIYLSGRYAEARKLAAEQFDAGIWNEQWPRLLIECQLATGRYAEARSTYENAIQRYPTSLTLRMLGLQAYRFDGDSKRADEATRQFMQLLQSSPSRYASRDNLVAAGRYFAMRGEDARQILEYFYDRVRDADPEFIEAYIATAELALEKGDFKEAAATLAKAEKFDANDPRIASLSAKAWENTDPAKASQFLSAALKLNPKHVPSLIDRAESEIDSEQYESASESIQQILSVNMHEPRAWSLLAVLAHLDGQYEIESLMRAAALSTWRENPEVDHLIGKKLSQKYRFAEGAVYQRRSLELDPDYSAASFQLAQDLLRLGEDENGWELAQTISKDDPYNVVAHNLVTLNDRVRGFTRIASDGIEVRMDPAEAKLYGGAVMDLLREAKGVLCEKYRVVPNAPIVVEIFPEQGDFAIRTFGLPGGAGFLGVCFGRVITANSPASQGASPANWQSVLWHEFCHVVTLEKTHNRMPRWLSEGISVYEERQREPSWGESMTPTYREMMLGDDLTSVSQLSAAFLSPKSPMHLQFAYYESSLVVEYLIEKHGLDSLLKILDDLADGISMPDALGRNIGSTEKLDADFASFATELANDWAAGAEFNRDELPDEATPEQTKTWIEANPNNYWALLAKAKSQVAAKDFDEAKLTLQRIVEVGAVTGQRDGPLVMLADVYRKLNDSTNEQATLVRITTLSSNALDEIERLIQISREQSDWEALLRYGEQYLAIQPLVETGYRAVVDACTHLDSSDAGETTNQSRERAVAGLTALAILDPVDPAGVDFQIAKLMAKMNRNDEAKRHVLKALDEAPRYRDAHRLLLQLESGDPQ